MIRFILLGLLSFNYLSAQNYELQDAFPNLYFDRPVLLTYAPDGSDRIFVVEQKGIIKVFPNTAFVTAQDVSIFLDISERINLSPYSENGLLGLAFHPHYAENGLFFVDYVTGSGDSSFVSRFSVSDLDSNKAAIESEIVLIRVEQPLANHNGGMIEFGPDGYLYISFGDGGWQYPHGTPDPANTSQDFTTFLSKMLRINVDSTQGNMNYSIPTDNPYYGNDSIILEEIFAAGFRNPWRFSIDQETGDVWVGDVGFATYEEINIVEAGHNYGWITMEGPECFPQTECDTTLFTPPVYYYPHTLGNISITGGYVYRGELIPELYGKYIYADYGSGRIWALDYSESQKENTLLMDGPGGVSAFGQDSHKELYVLYLSFADVTKIFRLNSLVTDIDKSVKLQDTFILEQNYPNPFNPATSINYKLPVSAYVSLKIFDVSGKEIKTLVDRKQEAGEYSVTFYAENLPSGVYIYKIAAGKNVQSAKMILLK